MFPAGSRIGLVPPPGLSKSNAFQGFEDAEHNVAMVIAAVPREALWDPQRSISAEELQKRGLTFEKREDQKLPDGEAFLVIAHQEVEKIKLRKRIFAVLAQDLIALVTVQIQTTRLHSIQTARSRPHSRRSQSAPLCRRKSSSECCRFVSAISHSSGSAA